MMFNNISCLEFLQPFIYNIYMEINKGLEQLGDLLNSKRPTKKPPAYAWQDLALQVIKELSVPDFKRSAVFKICKQKPRVYIEKSLNDTKELCQAGEKWKYFFKVVGGKDGRPVSTKK